MNTRLEPKPEAVTGFGIFVNGIAEHDENVRQWPDMLNEVAAEGNPNIMYSFDYGADVP